MGEKIVFHIGNRELVAQTLRKAMARKKLNGRESLQMANLIVQLNPVLQNHWTEEDLNHNAVAYPEVK